MRLESESDDSNGSNMFCLSVFSGKLCVFSLNYSIYRSKYADTREMTMAFHYVSSPPLFFLNFGVKFQILCEEISIEELHKIVSNWFKAFINHLLLTHVNRLH